MTTEPRDPRVRELVYELMQAAPPAPPLPEPVDAMTEDAPFRARRVRLIAGLLVVVIVAVTATVAVIVRHSPSHRGSVIAPTTRSRRAERGAVAHVDRRGLVVRAAGSDHDVVVASGAVSTPRWSPSGEWLASPGNEVWVAQKNGTDRRQTRELAGLTISRGRCVVAGWERRCPGVLDGRNARLVARRS